jgi:molecular chaperone HscA
VSGVDATIAVKPSYGLADEDIARMLQDSFGTAQQDMAARALAEARLDADRLLLATHTALAADGHLLHTAERATIDALMQAARASMGSTDPAEVERATQALAQGTEAFAAERMNAGIQKALAGKSISQV